MLGNGHTMAAWTEKWLLLGSRNLKSAGVKIQNLLAR